MIEYLVCWTANGVVRSDSYETLYLAEKIANEVAADGFKPRVERREFSNGRAWAPHLHTLFSENLDGLSPTELDTVECYHGGTAYGDYAALKRCAIRRRREGNVERALALESECEQIYKTLPAWQRWLASRPLACLTAEQSARRSPPFTRRS